MFAIRTYWLFMLLIRSLKQAHMTYKMFVTPDPDFINVNSTLLSYKGMLQCEPLLSSANHKLINITCILFP